MELLIVVREFLETSLDSKMVVKALTIAKLYFESQLMACKTSLESQTVSLSACCRCLVPRTKRIK